MDFIPFFRPAGDLLLAGFIVRILPPSAPKFSGFGCQQIWNFSFFITGILVKEEPIPLANWVFPDREAVKRFQGSALDSGDQSAFALLLATGTLGLVLMEIQGSDFKTVRYRQASTASCNGITEKLLDLVVHWVVSLAETKLRKKRCSLARLYGSCSRRTFMTLKLPRQDCSSTNQIQWSRGIEFWWGKSPTTFLPGTCSAD
ncbi:hypothetical protein QBC47DRAFT_196294 [Echria macrotheca]|uniref:Uncharacterized protein n=1 Tax=Echria macrotheca TaxID=438768 RepID=A0AAJ0F9V9_9PEZI|nr:hypothetical protein QBC47DRAFT_196294 [Echria macrotheca]